MEELTPSLLSLRHYRIPSYASEAEFKHLYPANPASCDRIFIRVTVIKPKTKAGGKARREDRNRGERKVGWRRGESVRRR